MHNAVSSFHNKLPIDLNSYCTNCALLAGRDFDLVLTKLGSTAEKLMDSPCTIFSNNHNLGCINLLSLLRNTLGLKCVCGVCVCVCVCVCD